MHHTLIVAKLAPDDRERVAGLFAESDRTELPDLVGVHRRSLYGFHDLYFHLIESDDVIGPRLADVRDTAMFQNLNTALAEYVRPYDPGWQSPKDAMAVRFYDWAKP